MKKLAGLFTAAVMMLTGMPVSADTVQMQPNYPLEHPGDATLYVHTAEDTEYQIEVLQTSPERKNLVLYGVSMPQKAADVAVFPLEAGDYTVRVTVGSTKDGFAPRTAEQSFNVLNLDFTNAYDNAIIDLNLLFHHDDTLDSTPQKSSEVYQSEDDGVQNYHMAFEMKFAGYDRLRGDLTGDGAVKMEDAYQALMLYTMEITHLTPDKPTTAGQIAACDFNGNGKIDINDAKDILDYVVAKSINLPVTWES